MATTKAQRYGIMVILIATVIGTIGSFLVMVLSTKNQAEDAKHQQQVMADYQEKYKKYQEKVDAQGAELSTKYYPIFNQYAARVGSFDRDAVKNMSTEDLQEGDGEEITDTTKFAAYYIGWDPKGVIFDQSIKDSALKSPLPIENGLKAASLIEGWKEGMKGMKINGVREITIPSDKAYGEQGSKDASGKETIAPNTPLKFIVMAIAQPEKIAQPEVPAELYKGLGGY